MEEARWKVAKEAILQAVSLRGDEVEGARLGALALLRATVELGRLTPASSRSTGAARELLALLLPGAGGALLQRLEARFDSSTPEWLEGYAEDEVVAPAFPPELLVMGLVHAVPRADGESESAWHAVDRAARLLGVEARLVSDVRGWRVGSADPEAVTRVEAARLWLSEVNELCAAVIRLLSPIPSTGSERPLGEVQREVRSRIEAAAPLLDGFHVERAQRNRVIEYLSHERFRLAVLGEFKRGKSTLINALVGIPDLMPTDILPCTSALIELSHGDDERFEVNDEGPLGRYRESSREVFYATTGDAMSRRSTRAEADERADRIPHWRVAMPSDFLEGASISLIDSPGLGEDYARDRIARLEAERADAALIIFDIEQLASSQELELIAGMKGKASDLIIVINRGDGHDDAELERARDHTFERISRITSAIDRERIVAVSALEAEEAIRRGETEGPWLERIEGLRRVIASHFVERIGPIKRRTLDDRVRALVRASRQQIDHQVELRQGKLQRATNLEQARELSSAQFESARLSIAKGGKTLGDSSRASDRFVGELFAAFPSILAALEEDRGDWTADHSVLSPKKHVREVAEKAQRSLILRIEGWVQETGAGLLSEEIEAAYRRAEEELEAFSRYLRDATGVDGRQRLDQIKTETFAQAFDGTSFALSGDVVTGTVVTGVVSVMVGYILADLILYYLLSLISGFLHPALIAAAVLLAVPIALGGGEVLKRTVRRKVHAKIEDALLGEASEARAAIDEGLRSATAEIFTRIAASFRASTMNVLDDARVQQVLAEQEMEAFVRDEGLSVEALSQEVERLRRLADEAKAALDAIDASLAEA